MTDCVHLVMEVGENGLISAAKRCGRSAKIGNRAIFYPIGFDKI